MKIVMEGTAKNRPEAIGLITEELLLNPSLANQRLNPMNLSIDRIEMVNGEKVVYIKENVNNLLCG